MYPPQQPSPPGFSFDGFVSVFVLLVLLVIAAAVYQYFAKDQALADYNASLEALRRNPLDLSLQANTLEKGRRYSRLTRTSQGVPMFDESAIRNDIDLAIAKRPTSPQVASNNPANRLATLDNLFRDRLISEVEYNEQRARILAEL